MRGHGRDRSVAFHDEVAAASLVVTDEDRIGPARSDQRLVPGRPHAAVQEDGRWRQDIGGVRLGAVPVRTRHDAGVGGLVHRRAGPEVVTASLDLRFILELVERFAAFAQAEEMVGDVLFQAVPALVAGVALRVPDARRSGRAASEGHARRRCDVPAIRRA